MFHIRHAIPSLFYTCNVRTFARFTRSKNPGIDRRLEGLRKENVQLHEEDLEDADRFDDKEANFYDAGQFYDEYTRDTKNYQDFVAKKIVGQKYFGHQHPNFLTWSEKEQIRHLHSRNPEEWTVEKISESFPIAKENIKKLLKVTWKPSNEKRILRHDSSAMRNWKELKENTLEGIPPDMRDRFLKFSNRVIPPRSAKDIEETVRLSLGENTSGEFSSIITGYQKSIEDKYTNLIRPKNNDDCKEDTRDTKVSKKYATLSSIRSEISDKLKNNEEISLDEHLIVSPSEIVNPQTDKSTSMSLDKPLSDKGNKLKKQNTENDTEIVEYLEKIKIPKGVWKKGGTYQVNDCYYDDDGLFLYRVPGMYASNKNNS